MASLYLGIGPLEQELVRFGGVLEAAVGHPETLGRVAPWSWGRATLLASVAGQLFFLCPQILGLWGDVILGLLASLTRVLLGLYRGPSLLLCQAGAPRTATCKPDLATTCLWPVG